MTELERRLGYQFADHQLLATALVHRSYANEEPGEVITNERLEFLGDSIVAFLVTDRLYKRYPDLSEGELTRARASLVNRQALASISRRLKLGDALILGRGARSAGGHRLDSILSDALEAVLGAIYLDNGLPACEAFVDRFLGLDTVEFHEVLVEKDYKTRLQEDMQGRLQYAPEYRLIGEPPDYPRFRVEVRGGDEVLGVGEGLSKSQAEQVAASEALSYLESDTDTDDPSEPDAGELSGS
ncbi:MAG: ribonuclease III [Chloroflexia bacterium]